MAAIVAAFAAGGASAAKAPEPAAAQAQAAPAAPPSDCTPAGIAAAFPVPSETGPAAWPSDARESRALAFPYFRRGIEEDRCGRYGPAIGYFSIALNGAPSTVGILLARGRSYLAQNRWQEAFNDFDAAIAIDQKSGATYIALRLNLYSGRATAEHGLGRYDSEVSDLTFVIDNPTQAPRSDLDPHGFSYMSRRAEAALAAGRYKEAFEWADDLWGRFPLPANWKYVYWRGQARQGLNNMRDAAADFDVTLSFLKEHIRLSNQRDDVDLADVYAHKGQALLGAQDWVGARTAFEEALKLDKDNALARAGQAAAPKPPPRPEQHTPAYGIVPSAAAMRAEIPAAGFCSAEVKNAFIDRINAAIQVTLNNLDLNTAAIKLNAADREALDKSSALTHDEMMSYIATLNDYRKELDDQRASQLAARGPLDDLNRDALATRISGGCPKP